VTGSIFTFYVLALAASALLAIGSRLARRHLRRPRLVQGAAVAAAALLIPLDLYCATAGYGIEGVRPDALAISAEVGSISALSMLAILVMQTRISTAPARHPRRILAIGAHPDDLELGCGGTLAKLADSGHEIQALVITNGERGGDREKRSGEAENGGRFIGATGVEVLDFTDTRLPEWEYEIGDAIEQVMSRVDPDLVLTHSANDQHQDHLAVHRATLRAARQHSAVLCYESPSVTDAFRPTVFVDIEDYVEVKSAAVEAHRDQRAKPYMTPERVRALATYRGGQAKVGRAEGYEPVRMLSSVGEAV
jgi:LmbE family N-acetylglucosaminyl deacetylase